MYDILYYFLFSKKVNKLMIVFLANGQRLHHLSSQQWCSYHFHSQVPFHIKIPLQQPHPKYSYSNDSHVHSSDFYFANWNCWNGTPAVCPKNSMIKNFTIKNFHWMPAMTKIFYSELFSHEYFQQQIFPKLQHCCYCYYLCLGIHA